MNKLMSRSVILAGAVLFMGTPAMAAVTSGLVGDCVDCHTMHNSEQGEPVAKAVGTDGTVLTQQGPIQNLLRMDCIACHADPSATEAIKDMGGGSRVPQVNHSGATDLAGGNFINLADGFRKGHNVVALGYGTDTNGMGGFSVPPGMFEGDTMHNTKDRFTMDGGFLANFTCAGSAGCHGIRNRASSATLNDNTTSGVNGNLTGENGSDFYENPVRLSGIPAISGAHHNSYDGVKTPDVASHTGDNLDGKYIADSYRFIPGLIGAGDVTDDAHRWQNTDATHHNEYYGKDGTSQVSSCGNCHASGTTSVGSHLYLDGNLVVPNQTITGFCVTCHGEFHSTGAGSNGDSGAFLRHPNDYLLPSTGEYSNYTSYDVTAPVARASVAGLDGSSSSVDASGVSGSGDMVMCLSCHMAHASQYDGMLRFDYNTMEAGTRADMATAQGMGGCYACHTTKGVLPENR